MKRLVLIPILIIIFVSCKKDKPPKEVDGKLFDISFHVSLFKQEIVPIGSSLESKISASKNSGSIAAIGDVDPSSPDSDVEYIYYYVFKDNEPIKTIKQTRGDADFGNITYQLPKGTYRIVVMAANTEIPVESVRGGRFVIFKMPGIDIFYETLLLNIEGQLNRNISLKRLAALLKVTTEDNIPYDVESIMLFANINGIPVANVIKLFTGEAIYSEDYLSETFEWEITESQYGKPFDVNVYIIGTDEKPNVDVTIFARNSAQQGIYSAVVNDIVMERGKQTNLKGSLFVNPNVDGAVIKVPNKEWDIKGTVNF